jgi:hypothetical protein
VWNQDQLYWRFDVPAQSTQAIATARATGGEAPIPSVLVQASGIRIESLQRNMVFQQDAPATSLFVVRSPTLFSSYADAGRCRGTDTNDSGFVLCRSDDGFILGWQLSQPDSEPIGFATGVPPGDGLVVDPQGASSFFVPDATSIYRVEGFTPDAGAPVFIGGLRSPTSIVGRFDVVYFIDHDANGASIGKSFKTFDATTIRSLTPPLPGLDIVVPDSTFESTAWFAARGESGMIVRGSTVDGAVVCNSEISGLGGIAVDDRFLYWTQADGGIYRQEKSACK